MIHNFRKVTDKLYRGSAPTPQDVANLKKEFGINKIVSLDKETGEKIDRTCKLLGIKHIKIYLNGTRKSLLDLFKHDLKTLLLNDGPTFVHCHYGKDRTGLVIALFKCKYMGMSVDDAIEEAKSLGFGINVDPHILHLYEGLIRKCKPVEDSNNADIVSNTRNTDSDTRNSFLDEGHRGSFAPYLSKTRQNPIDSVDNPINNQSPTRENYPSYRGIKEHNLKNDATPQVGVFNNDAGGRGFGPTENAGGFFYD